ncbi:MAG: HipA domain-containing protein [Verrucomicrobiales bacterium]|nr:HipA domain-containing protein [Verrucomicrobiales bacterium]
MPLILKFQDDADDDTPLLEHALSLTAKRCGIDAVDSMLVSGKNRRGGRIIILPPSVLMFVTVSGCIICHSPVPPRASTG